MVSSDESNECYQMCTSYQTIRNFNYGFSLKIQNISNCINSKYKYNLLIVPHQTDKSAKNGQNKLMTNFRRTDGSNSLARTQKSVTPDRPAYKVGNNQPTR